MGCCASPRGKRSAKTAGNPGSLDCAAASKAIGLIFQSIFNSLLGAIITAAEHMDIEYKIRFVVPKNYDASRLFKQLPSPIEERAMAEIYNYRLNPDGFYFVDRVVNSGVASVALRCFIDEAMRVAGLVEISKL